MPPELLELLGDPQKTLEALAAVERMEDTAKRADELKAQFGRRGGLLPFVQHFWGVLEPGRTMEVGWALEAMCLHLEAITFGDLRKILMNVPPGFMKSLLVNVFWPAWEWGPMKMPWLRYVAFSYGSHLTKRDNGKFRTLLRSIEYQTLYGDAFKLTGLDVVKPENDKTGWKFATSVGGVGTGERGDRVLVDDPHNVEDGESDTVRQSTVRWFRETLSTRLNDMEKSSIVVIMQRVHEADVSGCIISGDVHGYDHLMIPMEFDPGRRCTTSIGWRDPRQHEGELAWPQRFSRRGTAILKSDLGDYAAAAQLQQTPVPRGGAIIKADAWRAFMEAKYPPFEYVVASFDGAYTEKEENDPSALTVWGFYVEPKHRLPQVMLVHAWRKWLELRGDRRKVPAREPGDTDMGYMHRCASTPGAWGLVEWLIWSCRRWKVHRLLVESKATGITVAQEIQKEMFATEQWAVQLVDPKRLDKTARLVAVQPIFQQGIIHAPTVPDGNGGRVFPAWAQMVIDETTTFPKSAYKDLTDTTSQALKHLRELGLLEFTEEQTARMLEEMMHRPPALPLYNV